jgi:hypothetical protein
VADRTPLSYLALRETSLLRLILNIGIALLVFYILFVLKVPGH